MLQYIHYTFSLIPDVPPTLTTMEVKPSPSIRPYYTPSPSIDYGKHQLMLH